MDSVRLLEEHFKAQRLKPDNVILSLPRYAALSRFLKLPSQNQEEIKSMVSLYVRRQASYSQEANMIYDYQLVGFDAKGYGLVSVFYIQASRLEKYLNILEQNGIYPFQVTLNTQGLVHWSLVQSDPASKKTNQCVCFLNLDRGMADFNIFLNGCCLLSRMLTVPELKYSQRLRWLIKEVKVSLEYFRRMAQGCFEYDDKLYITGLTEKLENQESWEWPLESFNLFQYLKITPRVKANIIKTPVSFSSVLGLALGKDATPIDMTPVELTQKIKQKKKWRMGWKALVMFWVFVFLSSVVLYVRLLKNTERLEALKGELKEFVSVEKEMTDSRKLFYFENKMLRHPSVLQMLGALSHLTPTSIDLTDFEMRANGSMGWTGYGQDGAAIFKYWKALIGNPFFRNSRLVYVEEPPGKGNNERVKFRLEN